MKFLHQLWKNLGEDCAAIRAVVVAIAQDLHDEITGHDRDAP
jgi:hypothetical protein